MKENRKEKVRRKNGSDNLHGSRSNRVVESGRHQFLYGCEIAIVMSGEKKTTFGKSVVELLCSLDDRDQNEKRETHHHKRQMEGASNHDKRETSNRGGASTYHSNVNNGSF